MLHLKKKRERFNLIKFVLWYCNFLFYLEVYITQFRFFFFFGILSFYLAIQFSFTWNFEFTSSNFDLFFGILSLNLAILIFCQNSEFISCHFDFRFFMLKIYIFLHQRLKNKNIQSSSLPLTFFLRIVSLHFTILNFSQDSEFTFRSS